MYFSALLELLTEIQPHFGMDYKEQKSNHTPN